MRWIPFAILAYFAIAFQMALSGFINWGEAAPNLVLPVVVFVAVNARRQDALLAAFILGALQDLFSQHPPGLFAFSYGLVGLFVVGTQPAVYRDHPLTHFFVTLAGGLLTGAVIVFNEWSYPILHQISDAPRPAIARVVAGVLYSALLAPLLLWGLVRIKGVFGFRSRQAMAPFMRRSF
jgi:rod shape-determining protein MreD